MTGTATRSSGDSDPFEDTVPALRLDALQSFLVVAQERNLSRAAQRLFLTQSGVTRRIQALERGLGCQLLLTTTRRIQLTGAGRVLLPLAEDLVATAQRLRIELAQVSPLSAVDPPEDHRE